MERNGQQEVDYSLYRHNYCRFLRAVLIHVSCVLLWQRLSFLNLDRHRLWLQFHFKDQHVGTTYPKGPVLADTVELTRPGYLSCRSK